MLLFFRLPVSFTKAFPPLPPPFELVYIFGESIKLEECYFAGFIVFLPKKETLERRKKRNSD
jgi:hypothetical protein